MTAIISPCGRYRYRLERPGIGPGATAIIMVNPSTADAELDDATIRKLRGFGARNGWGRLIVGNLFAYRATDVAELGRVDDPVGPDNASHLARILHDVERVVFAWGPLSKQPKRYRHLWCGINQAAHLTGLQPLSIGPVAKCGHPKHPLMLGYDLPMQRWEAPRV